MRPATLLLLALPASSGCFSPDEPEKKLVEPPTPPEPGPPPPVDCGECGVLPYVTGPDGRMHGHDSWGGETRRVIASFDSGLVPLPLLPDGKSPGTAIADYDLEAPNLVYEGASHLKVVFTRVKVWGTEVGDFVAETAGQSNDTVPAHPAITIKVDYLTAADEPGAFRTAGQAMPGQPLVIPVSPLEADMPHQAKSLWLFRVYTGEPNAFTFNLTITAVKGGAVADWPPHPDFYAQAPDRTVLEGDFTTKSAGLAEYHLYGSDANWVYPERVISYGTTGVDVEVVLGALSAPGGSQPSFYYLDFKNASYLSKVGNGDLSGGRLVGESDDSKTFRFSVPVDAQGYDTPYGAQSRWGFRFMARFGDEKQCPDVDQSLQQGCQVVPYELTYAMKVVAHGRADAAE